MQKDLCPVCRESIEFQYTKDVAVHRVLAFWKSGEPKEICRFIACGKDRICASSSGKCTCKEPWNDCPKYLATHPTSFQKVAKS